MKTILCERLGIELPIIQAPMNLAVGPKLAAAVSNAGGLGMLVLWRADADTMRRQIREMRALTPRPFGVNLNLDFPQEERLEICLEERVPIISFFWRDPSSLVPRAKAGGAIVMHSVGSVNDARRAVDCGVDIVIAQGWEAGGHVRGMVATMPLVPAVVDAVSPTPVVAAGGIADGRGLAFVIVRLGRARRATHDAPRAARRSVIQLSTSLMSHTQMRGLSRTGAGNSSFATSLLIVDGGTPVFVATAWSRPISSGN